MSVLNLQIKERILSAENLKQVFSGSQNVDSIHVSFDSEWNGYRKTAVFSRKDCFFIDLDDSGNAMIPASVLEESGTVLIGIFGEKGNQRITSSLVKYRVGEGASVSELLDPAAMKSLMDLLNRALSGAGGITGLRNGITFIPSVSSAGLLSWSNDGSLDNPPSVNIKGPEGVSIKSITGYYARSSTSTAPTSGYSTSPPTLTSTYKYMWGYLRITLSNNQTLDTAKSMIGVYGNTGSTGPKGADGVSPVLTAAKSEKTTTVSITDANGTRELAAIQDGADGIHVTGLTQYFLRSSSASGITVNTSGWQTSMPALSASYLYMWTYFKVELSDGTSLSSSPMVIGNYNSRMTAVTTYFLRTSSTSTPTTSTSGWTTTYSDPTSAEPYVWCYFRFTYSAYGTTATHYVYSSPFKLESYKSGGAASGVVLDYSNPYNLNDKAMGDQALAAIQSGVMPIIYTGYTYETVIRAEPVSFCGQNYIRLHYTMSSCSGFAFTSVDWMVST